MNRKTFGKSVIQAHYCVVDSNVSINITLRESYIFEGLTRKTPLNRLNNLGLRWKTKRAGKTRQRPPALPTYAKDLRNG